MSGPPVDRRKYARRALVGEEVRLEVPIAVDADLLDLSSGGALVSTTAPLKPGQRALLQIVLDREPFTAWLDVKRVDTGTQTSREHRYHVAGEFVGLDSKSIATLKRFLRY
jgi:PilZ domain